MTLYLIIVNTKYIYIALNPSWKAFNIGKDTHYHRFIIRIGRLLITIGDNPNWRG